MKKYRERRGSRRRRRHLSFLLLTVWVGTLALAGCGGGGGLMPSAREEHLTELEDAVSSPPGIRVRVCAHYPRQDAKGTPGKREGRKKGRKREPSVVSGCSHTADDARPVYSLGAWRLPPGSTIYFVNDSTVPANVRPYIQGIMREAFAVWTAVDSRRVFLYGGSTPKRAPDFDGVNTIAWGRLKGRVIAATYVWYNSSGRVLEVDTVFNQGLPWAIFDPSSGECQAQPVAYDVESIATHEFGHWIGLLDLYQSTEQDLTMYGYSTVGELKKRTLGVGDRLGLTTIPQ